jgi:hypothetical protein
MDCEFLNKRLNVITQRQCSVMSSKKAKEYYLAYAKKLSDKLRNTNRNTEQLLGYIDTFKRVELLRMGFHLDIFITRELLLETVCQDFKDVVKSMRRWDGIENLDYAERY